MSHFQETLCLLVVIDGYLLLFIEDEEIHAS
jgi:hypothetical protein